MKINENVKAADLSATGGLVQNTGKKKGNPLNNDGLPFSGLIQSLSDFHIYSMRAFGPLFYVKRNLIAFVERPESV
jgi:hypothetical protein